MAMKKNKNILLTAVIVFFVLIFFLGVLFFYQQQGIIKLFSTAEERKINQALTIDESKFVPAQGLDSNFFDKKIEELYKIRENILKNPKDFNSWDDFAFIKEFLNDHEGAIKAWEISFEIQPVNFRAAYNLGDIYQYFIRDFEKSEFYYLKSLELRTDHSATYIGLMDLYRYNLKEKKDKYEPLVLEAINNDPGNAVNYYSNLVEFFNDEGNVDLVKAKDYLQKIKDLDPEAAKRMLERFPQLGE
jgi:tetratricopeptide (TPR) repeat protein